MPLELNDKKRKLAMLLFGKGNEAVKTNNLDYAIDCYLKCAKFVPDNLAYRQHLRAVERKKFKDNGTGAAGAGLRTQPTKMSLKLARGRKKWQEVVELAEDILAVNPWDIDTQLEIVAACKEIGPEMHETGHWVASQAAAGKDRADALIALADLCELRLMYGQAINALEVARKLAPDNTEVPARIRRLGAQDTLQRGGYEQGQEAAAADGDGDGKVKPPPRMLVNAPPAETPEQKERRELKELEAKAAAEPTNAILHMQAGDGYRRLGDYDAAARIYDAGFKSCGNDPELRQRFLEARLEQFKERREQGQKARVKLDKRAPDHLQKLAGIDKALTQIDALIDKTDLELLHVRLKISPDDLNAHYELGKRLRLAGQYDVAIPHLQSARKDVRNLRWKAQFELGLVFFEKRNYPLAERNLNEAQAAAPSLDESAKKEIIYWRGRAAEGKGDPDAAIELYNEVAAIDYNYNDIAERLDRLTHGGGGGDG